MAENNSLALRNSALAKDLKKSLAVGSLDDLVRVRNESNIWLLLDGSGSMGGSMRNGKTRIKGLQETVRTIFSEKRMPMIGFGLDERTHGDEVAVIDNPPETDCGGTPMGRAIDLAKTKEAARCIIVSDGMPDNQREALEAAQRFGGRIDVVFVGNPGEPGEAFLKRLAESTGGESFTGDLTEPKKLASGVIGLLTSGVDKDDEDE